MYCVVYYGFGKKYLAYQKTDEEVAYGYYLTDRETFLMNLSNNSKKHPTLFKSIDAVYKFIDDLMSKRTGFSKNDFSYEWIDSYLIPKCDMDCWKCNKKKKNTELLEAIHKNKEVRKINNKYLNEDFEIAVVKPVKKANTTKVMLWIAFGLLCVGLLYLAIKTIIDSKKIEIK